MAVFRIVGPIFLETIGEAIIIAAALLITVFTTENWPRWFDSLPLLSKSSMVMLILIAGIGLRAIAGRFSEEVPKWRFKHY